MINLLNLVPQNNPQTELFDEPAEDGRKEKHEHLMKSFDEINQRYGRAAISIGTSGLAQKVDGGGFAPWEMKREFLSPAYTTSLAGLPGVF
jgi:hypothetical protein